MYAGLAVNTASFISMAFIWLLILHGYIKANSRITFRGKFFVNISIITAFLFAVNKGISSEFVLLLGNNMATNCKSCYKDYDNFDYDAFEFDYSSILDRYYLHKKSIGDPSGPTGNNGYPDLNPYGDLADSCSIIRYLQDYDKILHNHPGVQNYKDMIVKDWIMYKTSDLQKAIKMHNEKLVPTKEHDLPVKKAYILSRTLNEFGDYRYKYKHPFAYVSEVQARKYDLTLEYNTLKKAKIFYDAKGVGLDDSFKNAFEIIQKRLIMSDNYFKIPAILFNPSFKAGEPHYSYAQDKNFIMRDYFDSKVVYHQIRESLLLVELELLKTLELLNKIKNKKFNYFNINVKEFDDLVVENNKTCLKKIEMLIAFYLESLLMREK